MADEADVLEKEQTDETTDSQETNQETEEETEQETEGDKPEGEKPEQTDTQEKEYWDTEEEYNESLGLGKRTNVQIAEYVKSLETKAETFRQTNPTWNPQPPKQEEKSKDTDFKFLPQRGVATKQLESMQFSTDENGQKAKAGWQTMTKLMDSALDPTFDSLEENMQSMRFAIAKMADHLQRQSYKNVKRKDLAPFEKIENYMKQNFELDAEKAVQRFLVDNNPDLLMQLAKDAEKAGEKKGQQFKFKKNSATRRGKPTTSGTQSWIPYIDKSTGELSRDKMSRAGIDSKKQHEIALAWGQYLESKES